MDLTGIGSVADFVSGVMDRFWPKAMSDEQRSTAANGMIEAMSQREVVRDSLKADVIKAEMAQGDAFTKRARPSIVYMGLLFIGLVYVLFPILGYFSKGELPKLELPSAFWTVWGDICSVWMIGRSAEKLFDGNKIVGLITGNKK